MAKHISVRIAAVQAVMAVRSGESLSTALPAAQEGLSQRDQALLQEICFGVMRHFHRLQAISHSLMDKPLRAKDKDIDSLLLTGIYQLLYTRIPPHAAIGETVQVTRTLGKAWARGLVNAVLRNVQRQQDSLDEKLTTPAAKYSHPQWLLEKLQKAWPDHWQSIATAANTHAPMTLRVNTRHQNREEYFQRLQLADIEATPCSFSDVGISLKKPCAVDKLPGFEAGHVSVQDEAAQLSAALLPLESGMNVLDACCAPGGKTLHMLEHCAGLSMTALDADADRLQRVQQNLERTGLKAKLITGDAAKPDEWWDKQEFDAILLDAPCSATGVIRRHPDIKLLRKPGDIKPLVQLQGEILKAQWQLLKQGGHLLYATCSVLPDENSQQIQSFLAAEPGAELIPLDGNWGIDTGFGRQLLPQENGHDGFFYCLLRKNA
ncbi:16S rRNA (cytosine(967)-C(5))-methyltransferase RsmB [Spongorhabdus nitratireducens]